MSTGIDGSDHLLDKKFSLLLLKSKSKRSFLSQVCISNSSKKPPLVPGSEHKRSLRTSLEIITLYTINLHNVIRQLYLGQAGAKKNLTELDTCEEPQNHLVGVM